MKRPREAGYTLITLVAAMTIMLITMGMGVPYWRHLVKDDREQELLFRGGQIADAIARYQERHANAPAPSLEMLVEQRFLRRLYRDPMTASGEWRLVRPGETIGPIQNPNSDARNSRNASAQPTPLPTPGVGNARAGGLTGGGVVGVASTSRERSLRLFNGRDRYDEWLFVVGQPRVVGAALAPPPPGSGSGGSGMLTPTPRASPTPLRR